MANSLWFVSQFHISKSWLASFFVFFCHFWLEAKAVCQLLSVMNIITQKHESMSTECRSPCVKVQEWNVLCKIAGCFLNLSLILYRKRYGEMSQVLNTVPAEFCHCLNRFWSCDGSTHNVFTPEQKQSENCSYKTGNKLGFSFLHLHFGAFWIEWWSTSGGDLLGTAC